MLGLSASGSLGDAITFQKRPGTNYVRKKPVPVQPNSLLQMYHRWLYQDYCFLWSDLSQADKQAWIDLARGTRLSGFQLYMKTKLLTLPELSGMWHLDYQSAGVTPDSSLNANHGTVFGAVTSPGHIHNSFYFDGLNDQVTIADDPAFDFTTALTVETWVNSLLDDNTWRTYVSKYDTETANEETFFLAQAPGALIAFYICGVAMDFINTPLVLNRWVHLAGVFDPPNLLIYKDGVLANSKVTAQVSLKQHTYPVMIGAQGDVRRYFKGYEDHVALWNIPLPPELIKVHSERRWP